MKRPEALAALAALNNASRVEATFARPADTAVYASGDLVGQSTSAGSVVPLALAVLPSGAGGGKIRRGRIKKSGTSPTNAAFRIHLFSAAPTPGAGDNAAFASTGYANYLGYLDVASMVAFSDGCAGIGAPNVGVEINHQSATIYALLECRGAYTPASAESFTVTLESVQT